MWDGRSSTTDMTAEEILLRRLANQHLLEPTDCQRAAGELCGVQAQFLSNALHALTIRCGGADTGGLVKSWTLRGTVHVFPAEDLPLFLHRGRRRQLRPCDTLEGDEHVTAERKAYFAQIILEEVSAGRDTREELKAACAAAGMTPEEGESIFNPWGGLLRALCEQGKLCHRVQEKKAFCLCPPFEPMEEGEARLELARRYFSHYGPATVKDAAYFFGTTRAKIRACLEHLPVTADVWEGKTYYSIPGEETCPGALPECLFLAGFDPLMLGYEKTESLFLPREHLRGIFSLAGIVMPAVLLRGKVVGRWKRTGRKAAVTLFEPVDGQDLYHIEERAYRLWPELKTLSIE